jgi:hypothetical protein
VLRITAGSGSNFLPTLANLTQWLRERWLRFGWVRLFRNTASNSKAMSLIIFSVSFHRYTHNLVWILADKRRAGSCCYLSGVLLISVLRSFIFNRGQIWGNWWSPSTDWLSRH